MYKELGRFEEETNIIFEEILGMSVGRGLQIQNEHQNNEDKVKETTW